MAPSNPQSHFASFTGFTPDPTASFEDEFYRLASSQNWVLVLKSTLGSARSPCVRNSIYITFPSPPNHQEGDSNSSSSSGSDFDSDSTSNMDSESENNAEGRSRNVSMNRSPKVLARSGFPEQLLKGYQALCSEVGLTPNNNITDCKRALRATLVNIVDLIDVRRIGQPVKVWDPNDFRAFMRYTLKDGKRVNKQEAKKHPGILASLLHDFRKGKSAWRARRKAQLRSKMRRNGTYR